MLSNNYSNNFDHGIMFEIPGYEKLYSITKDGEIYSHPKSAGKGNHLGKWLKPTPSFSKRRNKPGYLTVSLWKDKKSKKHTVHSLVLNTFLPNPNPNIYKYCNHKDGNKLNNHIDNLEWSTPSENNKHAYEKKLKKVSQSNIERMRKLGKERLGKSNFKLRKIKQDQIEKIKKMYFEDKIMLKDIAKIYDVNRHTLTKWIKKSCHT